MNRKMNREKFATKDSSKQTTVSCKKTQQIFKRKSELDQKGEPQKIVDEYSETEIFKAQLHLAECKECEKELKNILERVELNS